MRGRTPRFLRRISAVHHLTPEQRRALMGVCGRLCELAPQRDILVEGEDNAHGYVLEEGWACRYRMLNDGRRQILDFLLPGDIICGNDSQVWPAGHSVATLTSCHLYLLPLAGLPELCRRFPALQEVSDWMTQCELAIVQERIVDIGRRNAPERVAHLLLELMYRLRPVGLCTGRSYELPLTQEMMADALGLSIVHVNRTLRRLNTLGLIRYLPGQVEILDEAELMRLAEFDAGYLHQSEGAAQSGDAA